MPTPRTVVVVRSERTLHVGRPGPQGPPGTGGGGGGGNGLNGWSPILSSVVDGERRVLRVVDWTGGQGTKPATGYIGPVGLVGTAAAAVDVRGAMGAAGAAGAQGPAGPQGPAGADGAPGAAGAAGPQGPKGDTGDAGAAGADGAQGPAGPQGPAGEDGAPGATGATGPAGPGTKSIARFRARDNEPPATGYATLDTRNARLVLDFDDTLQESAVFAGVIPQGADLSAGLKVRIAWMATSATSGNARWGVQFERENTDADTGGDSYDAATEANSTAAGTSGVPAVVEITATSIDGLTAGDGFRLKVYRDTTDTTNDTMSLDAELLWVEVVQIA